MISIFEGLDVFITIANFKSRNDFGRMLIIGFYYQAIPNSKVALMDSFGVNEINL